MGILNLNRALNIALRAATLASRFLLIFFLARFLEPIQLGLYGLLAATIGYSLYFLGFDFYTFTTRELLKRDRREWGGLLKDQGALSLVLYAFFIPLLSLVFITGMLPRGLLGWFLVLLILEHVNQELSRLLVAISEQLLASVILFLRQGTWAIAITLLMTVDPATRSLGYVLGAWTAAGLIAALVGSYRLAQLGIGGWNKRIDWKWIAAGLKVSIPLLVATLAIRGIFTLDRYWLQSLGGLEIVGAYVLFMGIGGALMTFLDAGVFAFSYPGLIGAHQKKQSELFRENLRMLLIQTAMLSVAFSVVSLFLLPLLLDWLANPLYAAQKYLYPWVLISMVLYALGMVPHYALYAQGIDRPIIHSHVASLVVFVVATWAFSQRWPLLAVPLGLCAAFALVLVWKAWAFFKLTPLHYRFAQA
ncbi:lipopolysaccharide biosynthesis protein [Variovorax boronicumulans]